VEVARRQGKRARRHSRASRLNGARVGAAELEHLALVGDAEALGASDQPLLHPRVRQEAAIHHLHRRPGAQFHRHRLCLRDIARARHVHGQGHFGLEPVRRDRRPPQANLLLRGEHGVHLVRRSRQLPERLDQHGAAGPIVHRLGDQPIPSLFARARETGDVSHAHRHILRRGGPYVEEHLLPLGNVVGAQPLFRADDSHRAVGKAHPPAQQRLWLHAPHAPHPQESLLVDVGDDEANLVHVRRQHDALAVRRGSASTPASPPHGDEVAERIRAHLANHVANRLLDEGAHLPLVTRWAIGLGQRLDEILHDSSPPSRVCRAAAMSCTV